MGEPEYRPDSHRLSWCRKIGRVISTSLSKDENEFMTQTMSGDGAARALSRQAIAVLLKPPALVAAVLALWRFASEFNWAGGFVINSGPFSHWQIWLAGAGILQWCSYSLGR